MSRTKKSDRRQYGTHEAVATTEEGGGSEKFNDEGEKMRFSDDSSKNLPTKLVVYALCAALNSVNVGYDIGVSTNAGPLIQDAFSLSDSQLELFLGSINFWSISGVLISPLLTDTLGRRATFCTAAIGFVVGISIMATATSFEVLMLARAIVGVGVGIGEAIDPMYISEISPPSHRGELVSWAEAGVSFGVVLGFSSSLLFWNIQDDNLKWRYMLALGGVMPLVMLVLVWKVMPESPRWLLTNDRPAEARLILQESYPSSTNVDQVICDIQESLAIERAASKAVGWTALLCRPSPAVRRMLLVGIGIAIIQQAVGIDAVMFYLVFVIRQSGITSELGQVLALIVLGTVKLLFVFVGAKLFDRVGRRIMLFVSLLGMAASLVTVSFTFSGQQNHDIDENPTSSGGTLWKQTLCIVGLASYLAFFSTGLGPGNWVVVSEIFSTSIRAKAMSLAVLPNRITATFMASSFLTLAHALGWPNFFLLLAGICIASCIFLFRYLPETKGKTLEQMAVYFAQVTGDRSILDVEDNLGKQRKEVQMEEQTRTFTIGEMADCQEQ